MAIDTRAKRASAIESGLPWFPTAPRPDGALANAIDRRHLAWEYAGLLLGSVEETPDPGLSLPPGAGTVSESPFQHLFVCSLASLKWARYDLAPLALFVEEDRDLLTAGFADGWVYDLESTEDDGETIGFDVQTKSFASGAPTGRKLFQWLRLSLDTGGAVVTVEMYVDETLVRTTTVIDTARGRRLLPFPAGAIGYRWAVRLTAETRTRLKWYGCAAIFQMLGRA